MSKVKATDPAVEAEHTADPVRLAQEVADIHVSGAHPKPIEECGFHACPLAAEVIRLSEQREAASVPPKSDEGEQSEVQQLREVLARVRSIVSSWESEDNSFRDQILAALAGAPDEVRVAARPAPPA